ncbi:MAG: RNA polymerase sigma factor [Anaerolineales bacterium]
MKAGIGREAEVTPKPAFEALVERHGAEIHAYLWRLLQDGEDAQDILQETFLRAFRGYGRLNHGERARTWLYRIATRAAYTEIRRRAHRRERSAPLEDEHRDDRPAPAAQMEDRELLARVSAVVETLPARQRAALMLRKYQGLGYDDVGRALGCTPQTARAHVYQAMRRLRASFPGEAAGKEER